MTILDLNAPGYTMLHWLTILLENREFDTSAPLAAEAKECSKLLFVEIHCTLRQGSQIPFVVTSGQKSRPSKNIGSIPQRTIERQAKQLAFIIADQCDL